VKPENILYLNLRREFLAQIAAGTKRIEYRSRTAYWRRRLEGRHYDVIQFRRHFVLARQVRNGYATKAPEMLVKFRGLRLGIRVWAFLCCASAERVC